MSTAKAALCLLLPLTMCRVVSAEEVVPILPKIKRICVATFVGEERLVDTTREIAIAGLFGLKRFTITENCSKSEATLKGAIVERTTKGVRGEGEAADFGVGGGGLSGNGRNVSGGFGIAVGGSSETLYSAETGAAASVTLRLVSPEGDVLWAYTQDSTGGKSKGALADAVERAVKQLAREIARSDQN